jgi:DnaK suppressor protein
VAGIDFEAEGLLENLGDAAMFASRDFSFAGKHRFKGRSGDVAFTACAGPAGLTRGPSRIGGVDPERARKRLAEERERTEKQLAGLGVPEPADSPENSGDQAADLERAETDEGLRQELKSTLEAIERAEARLEGGTYGISVISGEPIPDGRLEALPWADRTVEEEHGGRA